VTALLNWKHLFKTSELIDFPISEVVGLLTEWWRVVRQMVPYLFVWPQQATAFFTLYTETSLLTKDVLQHMPGRETGGSRRFVQAL
jgi:hypothetical protein